MAYTLRKIIKNGITKFLRVYLHTNIDFQKCSCTDDKYNINAIKCHYMYYINKYRRLNYDYSCSRGCSFDD